MHQENGAADPCGTMAEPEQKSVCDRQITTFLRKRQIAVFETRFKFSTAWTVLSLVGSGTLCNVEFNPHLQLLISIRQSDSRLSYLPVA